MQNNNGGAFSSVGPIKEASNHWIDAFFNWTLLFGQRYSLFVGRRFISLETKVINA